jgi:DNA-binding FadR family transcriptional regulator
LRLMQRRMFEASWSSLDGTHPQLARGRLETNRLDYVEKQSGETGAERLTREMLRDIRSRGWKVGERLGGAEELMERFGASPAVLRQAVRMLEEYSAVHMQRGRHGGLIIAEPDEPRAIERAVSYLRRAQVRYTDLQQYLVQLTLAALNHSAAAADDADIFILRDLIERFAKPPGIHVPDLSADFHFALTRLSKNPALELFAKIIVKTVAATPKRAGDQRTQLIVAPQFLQIMLAAIGTRDMPKARRAFLRSTNSAPLVRSP